MYTAALLVSCGVNDASYRNEGQAYVDRAVPSIVNTWAAGPLLSDADPAFRMQTSDGQTRELIATFRRDFGSVRRITPTAASVGTNVGVWIGKFAQYTYSLDCEKGSATLVISVHRTEPGVWRILGFHVEPSKQGSSDAH